MHRFQAGFVSRILLGRNRLDTARAGRLRTCILHGTYHSHMLRKIRILLAVVFCSLLTLLFLDISGLLHHWFGWMAKIQFLPALLALNVGVVLFLILLTLIFGRVYCSVICPLGVFQDAVAWLGKKRKKNRYTYSKALSCLRYTVLALFIVALLAGVGSLVALLDPYASYGRIASNLFSPVYRWGNNLLAFFSERAGNYAFYETEVYIKSLPTFLLAIATLVILVVLAWRGGRTYCNTICPVGTVLGFLSRFSWFKPVLDSSKCVNCKLCERNCKASCIDIAHHQIDYSRCVSCMDCIDKCHKDAIRYRHPKKAEALAAGDTQAGLSAPAQPVQPARTAQPGKLAQPDSSSQPAQTQPKKEAQSVDAQRRTFLTATGLLAATAALKAQEKKVDGGLAVIVDKKVPDRATRILPAGSVSARHFAQHCTACQLCVANCPNGVLRPSTSLLQLMQPEMSYERGYCRPECVHCAEVCPAGAIQPISVAEKSAIQIGHAVWVKENCVPLTDGVECGNCARHCPSGAIQMILSNLDDSTSVKIPAINTERCIGCGACEYLCPARPFSAIYVEGHSMHRVL